MWNRTFFSHNILEQSWRGRYTEKIPRNMPIGVWGRGIGSATGLYFLEPLIIANIPAFFWLAYYGVCIAQVARQQYERSWP